MSLFQSADLLGMENISDGVCDAVGATNVERRVPELHISYRFNTLYSAALHEVYI